MARLRGNSWQGALKTPEKYYRYSFPTEAQAMEWEREAREAKRKGLPIPTPTVTPEDRPTLRHFWNRHRDDIWPGALPRNTESNQRAVERFLGKDILLHHITKKRLIVMVEDMRKAGYKPSTANTRLSHLKVLLRYAKERDLVDEDLKFPWVKKEDNKRDRFLTEDEERQLLALFNHWGMFEVEQTIATLIDTGCRPGELVRGETKGAPIKWSEVSKLAGGSAPDGLEPDGVRYPTITIKRTKTGEKGNRTLPLTPRAANAFLSSKQRGDKRPFGDLRADDLSAYVRKAADQLGMDDVVLYTMRHTCASRLAQRGASFAHIKEWMGHTDIKTTQRYMHLVPNDLFALRNLL